MKKFQVLSVLFVFVFLFSACEKKEHDIIVKEAPVKTIILKEESQEEILKYTGNCFPSKLIKKAFYSDGQIKSIAVREGEKILAGQFLASLDSYKESFDFENLKDLIKTEKKDYDEKNKNFIKFKKAYFDAKAKEKINKMSSEDLEKAESEMNIAKDEFSKAKNLYSQKALQLAFMQNFKPETNIFSETDGYVVKILQNESDMTAKGYPVLVIRTEDIDIKFGLSEEDKNKVKIDDSVFLIIDDKRINSKIKSISDAPDTKTGTYETTISLIGDEKLNLGESVKIGIVTGTKKGIWINLNNILNETYDYVYTVKDGRAFKKNIEILSLVNDKALVSGLEIGDELITSGYKSIENGYKVKIVNKDINNKED